VSGHGQNVARQAAICGWNSKRVPRFCVNKVLRLMFEMLFWGTIIMLGDADVVLAGGIESCPPLRTRLEKSQMGSKRWVMEKFVDLMIHDGLVGIFSTITACGAHSRRYVSEKIRKSRGKTG